MASQRIGFIGLGAMGLPMALNLLKNGYELHVAVNRNRAPVDRLTALGATEHRAVRDVIASCDTLITILPTDKEMESVLLCEEALNEIKPGLLLIEMTSGSPAMMGKVAEAYAAREAAVLDGPVSGGTIGAEQGTLTVMAGGSAEALMRSEPILHAMAKNIFPVGEVGAGKAIKAINQMLAGIHMIAASEAAALAERLGVRGEVLKQVIGSSSGSSWMLMNKLDSIIEQRFDPGFKLALMRKDVQIAVDEAGELALPLSRAALKLYAGAERELGDRDFSSISGYLLENQLNEVKPN